ncbi:hypothetical protein GS601_13300 [Myxacorys almedinensis A]|uniref:Uncharacterized protein n=1 Tax=Myxacorys almedinensis A TaxID=2690445 RepID=A0A8J7Z4Y0_9CYAN|nr:hypothetical protein [Myxacorys almedinensis A]
MIAIATETALLRQYLFTCKNQICLIKFALICRLNAKSDRYDEKKLAD